MHPTIHPTLERFIERMGLESEADGMPRIAGRVLGFLIAAENPASLDEIADQLRVSRASVSTNCRLLEQIGAAERTSIPGDRRDYYLLARGYPLRFMHAAQAGARRKAAMAAEALEDLPESATVAQARLASWEAFHLFIVDELERIVARWESLADQPLSPGGG
jgi:DNA-binding transcriptional regulator GbsR (MarR family)